MPRLHSDVPISKQVRIEVLSSTWTAPATAPSALVTAAQSSPALFDLLAALLFVGIWTRPPVSFAFSLSDCWAWLRYLPALATTSDLRLRTEWDTLDPHQKTVLSEDFGVGFTTWFLNQTLGFVRYADTLWVVKKLRPKKFMLKDSGKRGPKKSPDYIAEDAAGDFSVLECKGTQTSPKDLGKAINNGRAQKANLQTVGATTLRHALVAGLYVPQFGSKTTAVMIVGDPDRKHLQRLLAEVTREELARAVVGVAYAKELALLDLPNIANALVLSDGEESMSAAYEQDRRWIRQQGLTAVPEIGRVQRDYRWASPLKISEQRTAIGVRFEGSLAVDAIEGLLKSRTPSAVAEAKYRQSREHTWGIENDDLAVTLHSPLGSTFRLSILEQ